MIEKMLCVLHVRIYRMHTLLYMECIFSVTKWFIHSYIMCTLIT